MEVHKIAVDTLAKSRAEFQNICAPDGAGCEANFEEYPAATGRPTEWVGEPCIGHQRPNHVFVTQAPRW